MAIIKPFLRWAGGKNWLTSHLNNYLSLKDFNNYHEPFLGGGAVYLALNPQNQSFLSDLNEELINTYIAIKEEPHKVINQLKNYENTEEFYYYVRENIPDGKIEQAARFIYLNQTSYNGIYRVNQRGKYNVPYGFRKKNFIEEEKILTISFRLQNTILSHGDFEIVRNNIHENDIVFLDPPYTISNITNNNVFIKYNQKLFSIEDQKRLSNLIDFIKEHNAYYILTNAAHEVIDNIFTKNNDRKIEMSRSSLIGGEHAHRGKVTEYIFTNMVNGV